MWPWLCLAFSGPPYEHGQTLPEITWSLLSSQVLAQEGSFRDIRNQRPERLGWLPRGEGSLEGRTFTTPFANEDLQAQRGEVTSHPMRQESGESSARPYSSIFLKGEIPSTCYYQVPYLPLWGACSTLTPGKLGRLSIFRAPSTVKSSALGEL